MSHSWQFPTEAQTLERDRLVRPELAIMESVTKYQTSLHYRFDARLKTHNEVQRRRRKEESMRRGAADAT
jgi:hypothetical protein